MPPLAIILDPMIATGGTSVAAIQTLLEWGVKKVVVIAVLGSEEGLRRTAAIAGKAGTAEVISGQKIEGEVQIWVGGMDRELDEMGMVKPGVGYIGDRLFLTVGK